MNTQIENSNSLQQAMRNKRYVWYFSHYLLISLFLLSILTLHLHAQRSFTQRYITNIKGNLKVIGNTVLYTNDPIGTLTNADLNLTYVDIDNDLHTFNASSATIEDDSFEDATILWAGLYWQGYLHNDNNDTKIDTQFQNTTKNQILDSIHNQTILLKINDTNYTHIKPTQIDMDQNILNHAPKYIAYRYHAFADITSLLQDKTPHATYTVANIPSREGRTLSSIPDGLGNYGAWTLVIVYDNQKFKAEKVRNITIFDGYEILSKKKNPRMTIQLSGFLTPSHAPSGVDSTLSIFAAEGDRYILGDFAKLKSQNGTVWDLPDRSGAGSYFASVIEDVEQRNPHLINNNGIDIHTTQIGTAGGSDRPIGSNQTMASIILGTTGDTFMPSMIAFATELYQPKLCYDYNIRKDNFTIASENHTIDTLGKGDVSINVFIKSMEGDLAFTDTTLKLRINAKDKINFLNAKYSPTTVNRLMDASILTLTPDPQIGIGKDMTPSGGTIESEERYFAQFNYAMKYESFKSHFEFDLNTSINLGSGDVPVFVSSEDGTLPRCEQNQTYSPAWGTFNIERIDSKDYSSTKESDFINRYPLYTQIAGRDFDFSVIAYDENGTTERQFTGSIDIELINVGTYYEEGSYFRCASPDPTIIQNIGKDTSKLIFFEDTARVDVIDPNDLQDTIALRNAAFRIWVIVDENGSTITHTCKEKTDNTCFKQLYDTYIQNHDTENYCQREPYIGTTKQYYQCLRDNFAVPICSRDNFAIRPVSYAMTLYDTDEDKAKDTPLALGNNQKNTTITLAAGYQYNMDVYATTYQGDQPAVGYNTPFFTSSTLPEHISELQFFDTPQCIDKNSTYFILRFDEGKAQGIDSNGSLQSNLQAHENVGRYLYHIEDLNWTIVDQDRYQDAQGNYLKTFPGIDDCIGIDNASLKKRYEISENGNKRSGCGISSNLQYLEKTYYDLSLRYEPYAFDLQNIHLILPHTNDIFVYYNHDINGSNKRMFAHFQGSITALNKRNKTVSNFTFGCAAHDVKYDINLTISRFDTNLTSSNYPIDVTDLNLTDHSMMLSREYIDNNNTLHSYKKTDLNSSIPLTISSTQFTSENNGSATVNIYYNFNRIPHTKPNPTRVVFDEQRAFSPKAYSSAHLRKFIPQGRQVLRNTMVDYLYGRIVPDSQIYIFNSAQDSISISLYVESFCAQTPEICQTHQLTGSHSIYEPNSFWQLFAAHDSSAGDGNVTIRGTDLSLSPSGENLTIDSNATTLKLRITSDENTFTGELCITPDVSYLDRVCIPVTRSGGGGWAGTGNTGLVVDTNGSTHRRSSW